MKFLKYIKGEPLPILKKYDWLLLKEKENRCSVSSELRRERK